MWVKKRKITDVTVLLSAQGGVRKQECHDELNHKVSISGNYEAHECGLRIEGVDPEDAGQWTCEVTAKF